MVSRETDITPGTEPSIKSVCRLCFLFPKLQLVSKMVSLQIYLHPLFLAFSKYVCVHKLGSMSCYRAATMEALLQSRIELSEY